MKYMTHLSLALLISTTFTACGGGGGSTSTTADSTVTPVNTMLTPDNTKLNLDLNDTLLPSANNSNTPSVNLTEAPINVGTIPAITPSSQTSDEVVSVIKNAYNDIPFTEVEARIEQVSGTGPFYAADENGKVVLMAFMYEKYFGKNNWVFCHESTNDCQRIIDNSENQRFINTTQFAAGKLFMLNMDRRVDEPGWYGKTLAYYDPNTREFNQNALDIPGLNGGGAMSLGVDGYLYLSGSDYYTPNHYAAYAKVNPNDLNETTYHTGYYKDLYVDRTRSIAADNTHVYQAMGDGSWHLIAINQETQTSVKLLEAKFFDILQLKDGVALRYTDAQDVKHVAWLYNGQLYPTDSLDETGPWYDPDTHPNNHQGGYWPFKETYYITDGVSKPQMTYVNLGGQSTSPGYAEVRMDALINEVPFSFSIDVDSYLQNTSHVEKIDDERIMIRGRSYSGYAMLNTNNDTSKYLGRVSASGNANLVFLDHSDNQKKFMISGYPSGNTFYYTLDDTNKKFSSETINASLGYLRDIPDRNNPGTGIDIDIHRPLKAVQIDETVYFIGMQYRSGVGGALVAWNTLSNEKYAIKKGVFDNYQPRDMIKIGDKLAIATQAMDNTGWGGMARPSTPKILIFDPATQTIVKEYKPVDGLPPIDTGRIQSLDDRHIIGYTNNGGTPDNDTTNFSSKTYLYMIDTYTDEVIMKKSIALGNYMRVESEGSAMIHGFHFIKDGDYIYTWGGPRTLITLDKNGTVEAHGLLPYQNKMAFANGSIYLTGEQMLRKLDDPKK